MLHGCLGSRPHWLAGVGVMAAVIALMPVAGCGRGPLRPRHVLVVTLDTLRADRLGAYGHAAAQTPVLDGLAARGVRFASATTTTPLTLAAHTSLFTGQWPTFHGVRDNTGFQVEESLTTMAEVFKGGGYRTGGFVGAFVLDSRFGISQGFDHYVDNFDLSEDVGPGLDAIQRPGNEVVDAALAWLNQASTQPFFAWVHLYDPHTPYAAPAEVARRFPATRDGAYDAEVAFTDSQVGRLLADLEARGLRDETLVVVLADHGEQLGEHREQAHGFFVYDATVQVPLIVAGPGIEPRVVPDQVRIVDVLPTVLDVTGVTPPSGLHGTSLVGLMRGQATPPLTAFSESWYPRYHYGWSELSALRDGRFKFILAPTRELYDVSVDPGETRNLATTDQPRADRMERSLRALIASTTRSTAPTAPTAVDPAAEQRLRALGYVGGTSATYMDPARPRRDPKDTIELYNLLQLAGSDSEAGLFDAAIGKVQQALTTDPEMIEGHSRLANIFTKAGKHREAIAAYKRALTFDPAHLLSTFNLALAYRTSGQIDEAIVGFERAMQLDPKSGRAHFQLGDIYMQRGEHDKAVAVLTKGLTLDIDKAPFLVKLGEAYLETKRVDEAERVLREAVTLRADVPRGRYNLALIAEQRGDVSAARTAYEGETAANPKNYGAQFNLAKILLKDGRVAEAATRFRAAVDARPEFAEGYLYLAKALLDAGNLVAAEKAAKDGLARGPQRAQAPLGHYVLADVYARLGRENEAARQVALARRLESGR